MGIDTIGKYQFEIHLSPPEDPMVPAGPYYVSIADQSGAELVSTYLSHRFLTKISATDFCQRVADGRYPLHRVIYEAENAQAQQREDHEATLRNKLEEFFHTAQSKGVAPDTFLSLLAAYEQLPAESREMLSDPYVVVSFQKDHPMPETGTMTFGTWLETTKADVDVCLVDADTGEHYLNAVCYLSEEDREDPDLQYSDLEQWLFTLPVEKVLTTEYNTQLLALRTDFSCDQVDFLLGESEFGFSDQKWATLYDRAYYADAEFGARLAFLRSGTPFEVPFDPSHMDAASPADRMDLLRFWNDHPDAFIAPAQDDFLVVYYLVNTPDGGVRPVDCPVCATLTAPGRGLASSLEAKMDRAQQRAESIAGNINPTLTHSAPEL